jgi:arabinogalactan oligomer/maltooligosaccharide transport system substrate-binding protein
MKRTLRLAVVLMLIASVSLFAGGAREADPNEFDLWTQEGEGDGGLQFVQSLADRFMEQNPGVTINVVDHDTESLREDFQTASLAGSPPELLWTVNDHAGPFTVADLIQPVQDFYNAADFIEPLELAGDYWGVPISSGNHLMLMYNRSLLPNPPQSTDELISMSQEIMAQNSDVYGIVYNSLEAFWLVPWLGGFGGSVFAEDGVTPNLNTDAMVNTLQFLYDLEHTYGIVPEGSDYATIDTLFQEGRAAMAINGDWTIGQYRNALGDDFGIAPIPMVSSTGQMPAPYTSGKYFMVSSSVEGERLELIQRFIEFATSEQQQLRLVEEVGVLPARLSVLENPIVTDDPLLTASAEQMTYGVPMPSVVEMRAIWDAIGSEQNQVLGEGKDPAAAAADMQRIAETTISNM